MSESTLFSRAYVRGLNAELIRSGALSYPSKEAADHAADFVAKHAQFPDPYSQGEQVTLKVAHQLCLHLKSASDTLCAEYGGPSPELAKTASAMTPADLASAEAYQLMQKVAYENETPNTEEEAAGASSGARLDLANRPAGYANTGVGNYEDKGVGATGVEQPANRDDRVDGSNSATQDSKMAAAIERFRKLAGGSPYTGGGQANTPQAAAKVTDAGKLDQKNRPGNYANKGEDGVGHSDVKATGSAILGKESPASRDDRVSGSNTVTPLAKSAMVAFDKTAALVIGFLPEKLSDKEKVAHILAMGPLSTGGKAKYLSQLSQAYGADKTAAETLVAGFRKAAADEDAKEDFEVASAMEAAAEELEEKAVDDLVNDKDEGKKEAEVARLRDAASRIASR